MPTPQEEVAAFFAEAECASADGLEDETLRMLARASRKAFKDEDIRKAF